ncbi:MAG TPA: ribbon-helix-helix domain-containing protein [Jatrophihabitans sp.]|nr:ribbon-helix-helix domain-containing protein [Jatrophihabitans sp.]
MHLETMTAQVDTQLAAAAALGDDRTREIAAALAASARSSVRLAILDALSAAAAEITDALYAAGGGPASPAVTLRLDGDTVHFSVTPPPAEPVAATEPPGTRADEGEATARISLRLPDALKAEIEQAAGQAELSVNSWLIRAASQALRGPASDWESWSGRAHQYGHGAHRLTGWVTG